MMRSPRSLSSISRRFRRVLPSLIGLFVGAWAAPLPAAEDSWPVVGEGLESDESVVWGRLDNGLRYALMPNNEPPERVSLRLFVEVGSLMEKDHERGLAHFLEHMAFNGTKNFKPGEMVEYFQRLGMAFGADTNAHTSFKETVYKIELPNGQRELLEEGLLLFSDFAGKMLLLGHEIEKERGIILAEKLARDSVQYRTMVEGLRFSLPEARLSYRLPIGTEEVIREAERQTFIDFFQRWYTPDRMLVVAVGDLDVEQMEQMIIDRFGGLKAPEERLQEPDMGEVTTGRGLIAKLHTESEMEELSISIGVASPAEQLPDSAAKRRDWMVRQLADMILNRRFNRIIESIDAPVSSAEAYSYEMLDFVRSAGLSLSAPPEQWEAAMTLAEREIRRVLEHGFTGSELDEAKANLLQRYRNEAEQADTRRSRTLADEIAQGFAGDRVWTDPQDDFERAAEVMEAVTPEQVLESFAKDWDSEDIILYIGGNLELEEAGEQITDVWRTSSGSVVEAPVERDEQEFAYTEFGEHGEVVERVDHSDPDVVQVKFANGVRLNVMSTDFEENSVRVMVGVGPGKLGAPEDRPGLVAFAQSVFELGGLEAHSRDELQGLMAGKTVGLDISIGDDALLLGGKTTDEDLALQLQLLAAYVAAPGWREEGQRLFRDRLGAIYSRLENTPEGVLQEKGSRFLRGGDERFGFGPREAVAALTMEDARDLVRPWLETGYIEVSIVGDVDVEKAIDRVAASFGALPERNGEKMYAEDGDRLAMPAGGTEKVFPFTSAVERSVAAVYWPTDDMWDIGRTRRLNVLGQVLSDRLRKVIREKLGDAYSPAAYHNASDAFDGFGYLVALSVTGPQQTDRVVEAIESIAADLAREGIGEDELTRAIEPMLTKVRQLQRDNRYWLKSVLRTSQQHPQRLEWSQTMLDDLESITADEISALAGDYLPLGRRILLKVEPRDAVGDQQAGE